MKKISIGTERQDLFDPNIVITICARLNVMPPFGQLKEAFAKACSLHEVLGTKVCIGEDGEAFYIENEGNNNSISETGSGLTELVYENSKIRFRIEDGEFLRVFVSPGGLVFMLHHLGGDGKSLLYFIETFMNCLAGSECEYRPFRNIRLEDLPEDSNLPFIYKSLVRIWNRSWQKEKKIFGLADLERSFDCYWGKHKTNIDIREYSKEDTDLMLKAAKEAGVSLTAYLVCDLLKNTDKKADVGFAVDGRPDGNRSMGNQATGISINYRYDPGKSFEDNAKEIHRLMRKKLSDNRYRFFVIEFMTRLDPTLKDALNLEHAGYFRSKTSSKIAGYLGYGDKTKDISITNLTRADIPTEYGSYRIERLSFIPPVVSYAKTVYGIVTADDKMTVTRHAVSKR